MASIAIFGSALAPSKPLADVANEAGRLLARAGHTILTGACPGVSYHVARGVREIGGTVIGYSPATDLQEHTTRNQDPVDVFSEIIFLPQSSEFRTNLQACYKYRNIRTAMACDAALIINGRMGTLNEFTLAYDFGKLVAVLQGTGGVADRIQYLLAGLIPEDRTASVIFGSSPVELIDALSERLRCLPTARR